MLNDFTCVIIDDEPDAIELLISRLGLLYKNITVISSYSYWEQALEGLRQQKCDLLFMDISMPGKNGIDLLKLLPGLESEIIFVTAHSDFALDAFAFSTSGYILKPVDDAELSAAINKAIVRIQNKKHAQQIYPLAPKNEKIGIHNNGGIDYVFINDILYLESISKITKIITSHSEYSSSYGFSKFQSLIDNHSFFQIHRSFIINPNCILRYESTGSVIMVNQKEIPVSRSVKNDFFKIFNTNL